MPLAYRNREIRLSTGTSEPSATRQFRVRYTTGQPARSGQPVSNTFGLTGEGMLTFDADTLVFEGKRSGFIDGLRAAPRIALADVANVDYNAASSAFLIRTRNGKHYVIVWAASHEDAEALWALLPQEKTPEFLEDQAAHERFGKVMSMLGKRAYVTPSDHRHQRRRVPHHARRRRGPDESRTPRYTSGSDRTSAR